MPCATDCAAESVTVPSCAGYYAIGDYLRKYAPKAMERTVYTHFMIG